MWVLVMPEDSWQCAVAMLRRYNRNSKHDISIHERRVPQRIKIRPSKKNSVIETLMVQKDHRVIITQIRMEVNLRNYRIPVFAKSLTRNQCGS